MLPTAVLDGLADQLLVQLLRKIGFPQPGSSACVVAGLPALPSTPARHRESFHYQHRDLGPARSRNKKAWRRTLGTSHQFVWIRVCNGRDQQRLDEFHVCLSAAQSTGNQLSRHPVRRNHKDIRPLDGKIRLPSV
jgi:hypothetical protein